MIGIVKAPARGYVVATWFKTDDKAPPTIFYGNGSLWMLTPKRYQTGDIVNPREVLAEYQRHKHRERFTARVRRAEEEYIRLKSMTSKWLAAQQLRFLREHAAAKKEFDRCVNAT